MLRFLHVGPANTQLLIDNRRVVEKHMLLALTRPTLANEFERLSRKLLRKFLWIRDCRGRADELRLAAVELADAREPPEEIREMTAKHAAIRVQFVNHDELQILEQLRPLRVVREDALVQHVRVAEDNVA